MQHLLTQILLILNARLYYFKQPSNSQVSALPPQVAPSPTTTNSVSAPHDFLVLALVVTVVCAILNVFSLFCGIPAVILSAEVSLRMHAHFFFQIA